MCLISSILSPIAFRPYFHFIRRRTTLTQLNAFVVELLQCVTCQTMLQRVDAKDDFRRFLRNYPCQFSHRVRIVAISFLDPDSYQSIPNLSIVFPEIQVEARGIPYHEALACVRRPGPSLTRHTRRLRMVRLSVQAIAFHRSSPFRSMRAPPILGQPYR
jgi:hypothetical protein